MADTKISALTVATTPLAGTEVLPIVQSGVTKQVSVANLTAGRAVSADSLTLTGSPLPATSGGTGQSSYAVGDLLYASTTTALSKLADVATGSALISGGVGVAPSWGKIGLTTHVSGTLAVGNGGTGITSLSAGYIPFGNSASAMTSSGDLTFASNVLEVYSVVSARSGSGTAALRLRSNASYFEWRANAGVNNLVLYDGGTGFDLLTLNATTYDLTINRGNLIFSTAGKGLADSAGTQQLFVNTAGIGVGVAGAAGYKFTTQVGTSDNTLYRHHRYNAGGGTAISTACTQTTTAITTAKTIAGIEDASLVLVRGSDGGGNDFMDLVISQNSGTPTVITSKTLSGSPAARTYTISSFNLQLAMASGTYTTNCLWWQLSAR